MLELEKKELRRKYQKLRANLTPYQQKIKNRKICAALVANFKLSKTYIIAGYIPMESEVDITLALESYEELENRVCLPKVTGKNEPMEFREYKKGLPLKENKEFGFLEPENTEILVPDMVIAPLVAFDASCNRLGMGGGFYDRTLDQMASHKDFVSVGVAFECQQTGFILPEKHDFQLDAIITENRVFFRDGGSIVVGG